MIRTALQKLRTWVRPASILPTLALAFLVFEGLYLWTVWWKGIPLGQDYFRPRDAMTLFLVFVFGVLRASSLHPLVWTSYGSWLERTPWRMPKPLPLGPLHLTPRDAILLDLIALAMHDATVNKLLVPLLFLVGYYLASCCLLLATGETGFCYALLFGLGFVARLWSELPEALAAAALCYPLALWGLRHSLAKFPWSSPLLRRAFDLIRNAGLQNAGDKIAPTPLLGWPHDIMRPRQPSSGIGYLDGALVSLLVGWTLYGVASNRGVREFSLVLGGGVVMMIALGRIGLYCQCYRPPINLWGRVWTGRWIIPGYDKVMLPSIAVIVIAVVTVKLLERRVIEPQIVIPLAVSLALLVVLNSGPSLEEWRHTGSHRIVPTANPKLTKL